MKPVFDWSKEPTSERKAKRYIKKYMKCYDTYCDLTNSRLEAWNKELSNLPESEYNDKIACRLERAIDKLIREKRCFWNLDPRVDYTWFIGPDLEFIMEIREPHDPEPIQLTFHLEEE